MIVCINKSHAVLGKQVHVLDPSKYVGKLFDLMFPRRRGRSVVSDLEEFRPMLRIKPETPEFIDFVAKVFKHFRQARIVVFVGMGQADKRELFDTSIKQVPESGRYRSARLCFAVNYTPGSVGKFEEDGIALSNIENMYPEQLGALLTRTCSRAVLQKFKERKVHGGPCLSSRLLFGD